jgi:streptogramin lyase
VLFRSEVVVDALPDGRPKVVAFDRAGTTAYVGTVGGTGVVYTLPLDAAGAPAGPPTPFAVAGGGWHDAIGVDACGTVYVTDAVTTALYRLDPAGGVTLALDLAVDDHAHGLAWGSGVGGWRADALYLAQPYGGEHLAEVIVGVPAAGWRDGRYLVVP